MALSGAQVLAGCGGALPVPAGKRLKKTLIRWRKPPAYSFLYKRIKRSWKWPSARLAALFCGRFKTHLKWLAVTLLFRVRAVFTFPLSVDVSVLLL